MKLGVPLRDIDDAPALLLDALLDIDGIYREVEGDAGSGPVDG